MPVHAVHVNTLNSSLLGPNLWSMVMLWLLRNTTVELHKFIMYRVHAVLLCCAVLVSRHVSICPGSFSVCDNETLFLVVGDEWTGTGECVSE